MCFYFNISSILSATKDYGVDVLSKKIWEVYMNYYDEIKNQLIDNEINKKVKD